MAYKLSWLADVLAAAGQKVIEENGWKDRGRAEMGDVKGILAHHTAGAKKGNSPSLKVVRDGRPDLPGPLSQLFLARDGTWHVMAAGRCNHAGEGRWQGGTGNSQFIGIEAENAGDGKDDWPDVQMKAYVSGAAAILAHMKADAVMVAGHKEYATPKGRKIDPAFDMVDFRDQVELVMDGKAPKPKLIPSVNPAKAMLRKGSRGPDVKILQKALQIKADGDFGPATEIAVRAFQKANGLIADGRVGPKTWALLLKEGK